MGTNEPLAAFGSYLYQGIADGVSSPAELASRTLALMSGAERVALRPYLEDVLERLTASELKGRLNRVVSDYRFSSRGAKAFLTATLDQLSGHAQVRNRLETDTSP